MEYVQLLLVPIAVLTVAFFVVSRILRWPLSYFLKGLSLPLLSDMLALIGGYVAFMQLDLDTPDFLMLYLVCGIVVIFIDWRIARSNTSKSIIVD